MKLYKITNIIPPFGGDCDYKGLDINQFVPGSQIYAPGCSMCIIATHDDSAFSHVDVVEITQEQYLAEKEAILATYPKENPEETIQQMQTQIDELTIMLCSALLGGAIQ